MGNKAKKLEAPEGCGPTHHPSELDADHSASSGTLDAISQVDAAIQAEGTTAKQEKPAERPNYSTEVEWMPGGEGVLEWHRWASHFLDRDSERVWIMSKAGHLPAWGAAQTAALSKVRPPYYREAYFFIWAAKQPDCTLALLGRDVATVCILNLSRLTLKVIVEIMDELSKIKKNVDDIQPQEKEPMGKLIRDDVVEDKTFLWDHQTYELIKREKTDHGWKLFAKNGKHNMMVIPCMRCLVVTLHTDPEKEEVHRTGTDFLIQYLISLTY